PLPQGEREAWGTASSFSLRGRRWREAPDEGAADLPLRRLFRWFLARRPGEAAPEDRRRFGEGGKLGRDMPERRVKHPSAAELPLVDHRHPDAFGHRITSPVNRVVARTSSEGSTCR